MKKAYLIQSLSLTPLSKIALKESSIKTILLEDEHSDFEHGLLECIVDHSAGEIICKYLDYFDKVDTKKYYFQLVEIV